MLGIFSNLPHFLFFLGLMMAGLAALMTIYITIEQQKPLQRWKHARAVIKNHKK